ncbi:alpha-L-fucosidase C-terminal domain-containing protein [Massilia luteola]|uniref:alpha-L-fucosidase C-terminal domain-containing protein n=1 Tax=Massilia luteola TaxID=3081751 RepID=UPI002ACC2735|nr:alpha-L-fucosidase C-terminal domain-containing protein [Massilia sp. Gc5]
MKRRQLLKHLGAAVPAVALSPYARAADALTQTGTGTIAAGPFAPTWDSLSTYQTPDWFRNAKFGIWAHWAMYGEGPVALEGATSKTGASFNEGKGKPFSADDVRFTAKGKTVFAFIMGWPASGKVSIAAMGSASVHLAGRIRRVELLGVKRALAFEQTAQGLQVTLPADIPALAYANALKIS